MKKTLQFHEGLLVGPSCFYSPLNSPQSAYICGSTFIMSAPVAPVISHIAFKVTNLLRSTRFYADVVGLQPIPEPFKLGMHSWFALGPHCQLHLIAGGKVVPTFHIDHHLAFSTAHFNAFVARLKEAGIPYYDPKKQEGVIHSRPDGIRQVFFQDPDGYWLEMNDEFTMPATT